MAVAAILSCHAVTRPCGWCGRCIRLWLRGSAPSLGDTAAWGEATFIAADLLMGSVSYGSTGLRCLIICICSCTEEKLPDARRQVKHFYACGICLPSVAAAQALLSGARSLQDAVWVCRAPGKVGRDVRIAGVKRSFVVFAVLGEPVSCQAR